MSILVCVDRRDPVQDGPGPDVVCVGSLEPLSVNVVAGSGGVVPLTRGLRRRVSSHQKVLRPSFSLRIFKWTIVC